MKKNAVIINLNICQEEPYTVGAFSIVRALNDLGISTSYFDNTYIGFDFNNDELKKLIFEKANSLINEDTIFIGFSTLRSNIDISIECAHFLKRTHPSKTIGFGGVFFATIFHNDQYKEMLKPFDFYVKGKGHDILKKLVEWSFDPLKFTPLKGFNFKKDNDFLYSDEQAIFEDYKPFSYVPDFNRPDYIETSFSVGCPYRCSFCSQHFHYPNFIRTKVEDCIDELRPHKNKTVFFTDALINNNHKWLENLCQRLIEEDIGIKWQSWFRVSRQMNNSETLELLYNSGCRIISFGLESASSSVLKHMKKFHNEEQIYLIFDKIRKLNKSGKFIRVKLNIIAGYPTETDEDFNKTYTFLKFNSDIIASISINPALINLELRDFKRMFQNNEFIYIKSANDWATPVSTPVIRLERLTRLRGLLKSCEIEHHVYNEDALEEIIQNNLQEEQVLINQYEDTNIWFIFANEYHKKNLLKFKNSEEQDQCHILLFPTINEIKVFFKQDNNQSYLITSTPTKINKWLSRGSFNKFKAHYYIKNETGLRGHEVTEIPIHIITYMLLSYGLFKKHLVVINRFINKLIPTFSFHSLYTINKKDS